MEFKTRADWLAWRKTGIGSSDAPIIMGVSLFKTPTDLYLDKIDTSEKEEEETFITRAGNDAESKVRAYFEVLQGKSYSPIAMFNKWVRFLLASLDGLSDDGTEMIEIKLVGKDKFEEAKSGKVPDCYYPQVQHGLLVSEAKLCYYISYLYDKDDKGLNNPMTEERLSVVTVYPNEEYQNRLIKAEDAFWGYVLSKTPPPLSERDAKKLPGNAAIVNKRKKMIEKVNALILETQELENQIKAIAEASGEELVKMASLYARKIDGEWNLYELEEPSDESAE